MPGITFAPRDAETNTPFLNHYICLISCYLTNSFPFVSWWPWYDLHSSVCFASAWASPLPGTYFSLSIFLNLVHIRAKSNTTSFTKLYPIHYAELLSSLFWLFTFFPFSSGLSTFFIEKMEPMSIEFCWNQASQPLNTLCICDARNSADLLH